jgi:hypothetical protein
MKASAEISKIAKQPMTLKQDSFILLGANMRLRMDTVATP